MHRQSWHKPKRPTPSRHRNLKKSWSRDATNVLVRKFLLRGRFNPEQPYTAEDVDWVNEQSRCTQEHLNQSLRPALKPVDVNFAEVDTVFIGFPIWWHEEPAIIRTFLDNYKEQLKGKVLYPFCTSYESSMSEADATLRKGYPDYNWKTGLRLPAKTEEIKKWIDQ